MKEQAEVEDGRKIKEDEGTIKYPFELQRKESGCRRSSSLSPSPSDVSCPLVLCKRLAQQKAACLPGRPISFPQVSSRYMF